MNISLTLIIVRLTGILCFTWKYVTVPCFTSVHISALCCRLQLFSIDVSELITVSSILSANRIMNTHYLIMCKYNRR